MPGRGQAHDDVVDVEVRGVRNRIHARPRGCVHVRHPLHAVTRRLTGRGRHTFEQESTGQQFERSMQQERVGLRRLRNVDYCCTAPDEFGVGRRGRDLGG